jgi:hypothetical protein
MNIFHRYSSGIATVSRALINDCRIKQYSSIN